MRQQEKRAPSLQSLSSRDSFWLPSLSLWNSLWLQPEPQATNTHLASTKKFHLLHLWRMGHNLLHYCQSSCQIVEIEHFNRRMRIAARQLDLHGGSATSSEMRGSSVGDTSMADGELVGRTDAFGSGDHDVQNSAGNEVAMFAGGRGGCDERTLADASG